jgi:hypothetical protein
MLDGSEVTDEILFAHQEFKQGPVVNYTIMIIRLLIYTSMRHSLLSLKLLALVLNSLDTLSDVRLKHLRFFFN